MRSAFHEEQRLNQWWVRALVLVVAGTAWWAFFAQVVGGRQWGDEPVPDWAVWLIFFLVGLGLPALILLAKLVVTVDDTQLRIRWFPLARKTIRLREIRSAEACTYRPLLEYGGWGLRRSLRHGWAWNAHGNRGVRLVLANGKKLLIGSQLPEKLEAAIREKAAL